MSFHHLSLKVTYQGQRSFEAFVCVGFAIDSCITVCRQVHNLLYSEPFLQFQVAPKCPTAPGGFLGTSFMGDTPGQTQNSLERLYLLSGLGIPQEELGWREEGLGFPLISSRSSLKLRLCQLFLCLITAPVCVLQGDAASQPRRAVVSRPVSLL